jgi:hypothetical protein
VSIREFVVRLEEYFGKWSSALVLENIVREVIKYSDEDREQLFVLITRTRPEKWGPPDLYCLMSILENSKVDKAIIIKENRGNKKCPVCSWRLRSGYCMHCDYSSGDDVESHRLWWEKFKNGAYQDIHFDKERIRKVNVLLLGVNHDNSFNGIDERWMW